MKTNPPPDRRKFTSTWDEINYLYGKLLYWLYQREDLTNARRYSKRLERLLPKASPDHEAILGEECWSLVHEAKGDLPQAIKYRENEIRLIRRLHQTAAKMENPQIVMDGYGYDDLSDRLDLLATLYHDSGNLDRAITTLQESKQLCKTHRVKFDGQDMLEEYLEEKRKPRHRSAVRTRAAG